MNYYWSTEKEERERERKRENIFKVRGNRDIRSGRIKMIIVDAFCLLLSLNSPFLTLCINSKRNTISFDQFYITDC